MNAAGDPLHFAVMQDNPVIVDLLTKNKSKRADVNATNKEELTPVQLAIVEGKMKALCSLLNNSEDSELFTAEGHSLLQFAISMGSLDSVKLILARGSAPVTKDGAVSYFLHLAICHKRTENVLFLLEMGVDPYEPMIDSTLAYIESVFPDYDYGLSKSDPAIVIAILNNDFEAFKALLNHGMNSNTRIFQDSSSLLHLACEIGNAQTAAYLISIGADDQCIDSEGQTPLTYNDYEFRQKVISLL